MTPPDLPPLLQWDKEMCLASADRFVPLLATLWPEEDWSGMAARLAWRHRLCAIVCLDRDGQMIGFKMGYEREGNWLHSWLGGVAPDWRGRGLARALMHEQHAWARQLGFSAITTSTRQINPRMAILNLRAGFLICGFESRPGYPGVVEYHKAL